MLHLVAYSYIINLPCTVSGTNGTCQPAIATCVTEVRITTIASISYYALTQDMCKVFKCVIKYIIQ